MNVYNLNDYFEFHFNLSRFDTGAATDADATPTWRCYEENNDTVVTNDDCAKRDDANTLGYYYARGQITSVAGFELGKNYVVRASATVNAVSAAAVIGTFKVVSVTRGLSGTALPDAAADGAGGLPISDAGGLDLDTLNGNVSAILTDTGTDGVVIAAGAITATAIATGAIDADAIADNAIDAGAIAADAITAAKIANGAIDAATFAAGAINAAAIADAAIDAATFAAGAIDAAAIADGAIDAATFAANAITSTVIADDAITAAKLNTGAITADAFAADAIVAATLATGAITADAFAADSLVAATFATNSITADALAADAVTEIQAGLALETTAQDILTDTGTTLPGTLTTIEGKVDTVDGIVDTILVDTNELQTDLTNGGRLDLLIDAIKAKTDLLPVSPAKNEALPQFVFLMVDNTDHITPLEGLTVSGQISKDGGAFAGISSAIAEISNGYYKVTTGFTQAEMNADVVALRFSAVGADQRSIIIVTSS